MTERKTEKQHDDRRAPVPLAPPVEKYDADLKASRALFERRRKAVASCHLAAKAMEEGTRVLVTDAMDQIKKITGQPITMLFAMLPSPNSHGFAALLTSTQAGGVELAKARWKYEILYSTATPLHQVYEALMELVPRLERETEQTCNARNRTWLSDKDEATVTKHKETELQRVKSLLSSLEAVVSILDRLSEKVGAERFEVNEAILARWDKASENGRKSIVAEAWGSAKAVWSTKVYQKTLPAKQLRMLRVLMRYQVVEPVLEPWCKLLEVVAELRECCSK